MKIKNPICDPQNNIVAGALYKALKEIRKLVKREDELLAA
jgi:flagellar biosynthesis regulator FlbT